MGNLAWTLQFPNSAVYHLPRFSSDHLPILMRPTPVTKSTRVAFRCENWWTLRKDFPSVYQRAVEAGPISWSELKGNFKTEVKKWVRKEKSPNQMLLEIEKQMEVLNSTRPDLISKEEEDRLQEEHDRCLLMKEMFWHQ